MTVLVTHARRPLARKSSFAGLAPLNHDEFEGYASLFNVRDGAGDSVAPGAFASSLRRRGPSGVRMLYQHFSHSPIGVWEEIAEDSRGLYVRGRHEERHRPDAAAGRPWGFVRLLDAAASGAAPADVRARVAPGQPDDAASDVGLPEALALLAADFGAAHQNAGQLEQLERAVGAAN